MAAEGKKAPDDGVYVWNGRQYRAKAGETMPPGAEFRTLREGDMTDGERKKAEERRARAGGRNVQRGSSENTNGQGASETTNGEPKWFRDLQAKAGDTAIAPRLEAESEAAYKARVTQPAS